MEIVKLEELQELISAIEGFDHSGPINSWLEANLQELNIEDLKAILPTINEIYQKYDLAANWLKRTENNFATIAELKIFVDEYFVTEDERGPDDCKSYLTIDWLKKSGNNVAIDELEELLNLVSEDNIQHKIDIEKAWLKTKVAEFGAQDLELKRRFIERAKKLYPDNQLLNIDLNGSISEVVAGKNLEESLSELGLKKAQELFGNLAEVNLAEFLAYCDFTGNISSFVEMLKPEVLDNIRSNFKLLNHQSWFLENDGRNLEILTGLDFPQLESLCDVLLTICNIPVFDKSKIDEININFGDVFPRLSADKIVKFKINFNNHADFEDKEDLQRELNEDFKALLLAGDGELNKKSVSDFFKKLTFGKDELSDENQELLLGYFKEKRYKIADAISKKGFQAFRISILSSEEAGRDGWLIPYWDLEAKFSPEEKAQLNKDFQKLLSTESPAPEDVISFLRNLVVEYEFSSISEANQNKLVEFFVKNKDKIVYLFSKPGGVESFGTSLSSLMDGCAANIGTHISKAVNQNLAEEPDDKILYEIFDKVALEIINSGGDNLDDKEHNLLKNKIVRRAYFNFEGLVDIIVKDKPLLDNCHKLLISELGKETADELYAGDDWLYDATKYAEKCLLFILSKRAPDIFKHPALQEMKEHNEDFIREHILLPRQEGLGNDLSVVARASDAILPEVAETPQKKRVTFADTPTTIKDRRRARAMHAEAKTLPRKLTDFPTLEPITAYRDPSAKYNKLHTGFDTNVDEIDKNYDRRLKDQLSNSVTRADVRARAGLEEDCPRISTRHRGHAPLVSVLKNTITI